MATTNEPVARGVERVLLITRVLDAPANLVFDAWTNPEQLVRWWGPKGFATPFCEMDVRPGGAYRLCMRSPEGRDYWLRGVFREIVRPERLVFAAAITEPVPAEAVSTVTFAEHGGKTTLTVYQVFAPRVPHGAHEGWNQGLDRLALALAKR